MNNLTECADREINSPDGETEQSRTIPETLYIVMSFLSSERLGEYLKQEVYNNGSNSAYNYGPYISYGSVDDSQI